MKMWQSLLLTSLFAACSLAMEGIVETLSGGGYPHVGEVEYCDDNSVALDGGLNEARFNYPWGIMYDREKSAVYVADCGCPETEKENDLIRKIDLRAEIVSTVAGSKQGFQDGEGRSAQFSHIAGMVLHQRSQVMFIADSGNDVIRMMDLATNEVSTFAGKAQEQGFRDGPSLFARFNNPQELELHESTTRMFVADTDNHAIRAISMSSDQTYFVQNITGGPHRAGFKDGALSEAKWRHPTGMAYDQRRDVLYVSDHYNHAVRKVDLVKGVVTTLAGNGFPGNIDSSVPSGPLLNYPEGIVHDSANDVLYFVEFSNNCVRMLNLLDNSVQVLAGGVFGTRDAVGRDAQFYHPTDLDFDPERKLLYVTDQYNHRIRTVTALGNSKIAHPSAMVARHMASVDAYRDLLVHNRFSVFTALYVCLILLCVAVFFYLKPLFYRCANIRLGYRKIAKGQV